MGNKILKFICAAGNEDLKEIEKLSYVCAMAGFNMIDTAAKEETVNAVLSGIKKAKKENSVNICISIGLKDDIHLSKADINPLKCNLCGICAKECPRSAILFREKTNALQPPSQTLPLEGGGQGGGEKNTSELIAIINEKRCIGCAKCIKICPLNAISLKYGNVSLNKTLFQNKNVNCVEFHCTSDDEQEILRGWRELKSLYNGQLSICMNRSKQGDERIISLLKQMTEGLDNVIIQADGNPMSGGIDDYKSNLQTVAFAQLIRSNNINAKIILSGGTNSKTDEFARLCEVEIDGIAIGSFARKIVKDYIKSELFWEDEEIQKKAVEIATSLVNKLEKNKKKL